MGKGKEREKEGVTEEERAESDRNTEGQKVSEERETGILTDG